MVVGGWRRGIEKNENVKKNHNKDSLDNLVYWVLSGLVSSTGGRCHRNGDNSYMALKSDEKLQCAGCLLLAL